VTLDFFDNSKRWLLSVIIYEQFGGFLVLKKDEKTIKINPKKVANILDIKKYYSKLAPKQVKIITTGT
jgi:hypothetical protein